MDIHVDLDSKLNIKDEIIVWRSRDTVEHAIFNSSHQQKRNKTTARGRRYSIVGRVLVLHAVDSGLIDLVP